MYTFNTAAPGVLLPTHSSKHTKIPKAPSQPVFRCSLSNPLLPLVGQKLSGLAPFLEGNKVLVPTLGSPGNRLGPHMETDALYRPCPVRYVLLCSFPLEGGACREARLDFGRLYPLPWRGQDNPLHPESMWQEFSECQPVGEEHWLTHPCCSFH